MVGGTFTDGSSIIIKWSDVILGQPGNPSVSSQEGMDHNNENSFN